MRGLFAHAEDDAAALVEGTCSTAIGGRRAARLVAEWAKRFGLTEAEFQLLWRLRTVSDAGLDQTTLAGALAFSPAQISASVERLQALGRIRATSLIADRRRRHWQLAAAGRELLDQMLVAAALLRDRSPNEPPTSDGCGGREAAA